MKIEIQLHADSYNSLLRHVPENSHAYDALKNSEKIAGSLLPAVFLVTCDGDQARVLLQTARQHCPWAASGIENQITLFWLRI
jgi:hypothetical protein